MRYVVFVPIPPEARRATLNDRRGEWELLLTCWSGKNSAYDQRLRHASH